MVLTGGHAAGKTWIAKKLQQTLPESQLFCLYGDVEGRFKCTVEERKIKVAEIIRTDSRHILFEGCRACSGMYEMFLDLRLPSLTIFALIMSGNRLLQVLKHRVQLNGKVWTDKQESYWVPNKCAYEAEYRYTRVITRLADAYPEIEQQNGFRVLRQLNNSRDFSVSNILYKELHQKFQEKL